MQLLWAPSYHSDWCLRNANNSKINNTGQAGRAPGGERELLPSSGTACIAFSALPAPRWLQRSSLPGQHAVLLQAHWGNQARVELLRALLFS